MRLLIQGITTSGTGSGSRGDERYHFANIFPHFVAYGDHHIDSDEKTISEVHFVVDDASTLFYDFDAFGSLIDAKPFIKQIAHGNALPREIKTGPDPEILYFTGKREIFAADTVLGRVSALHSPSHSLGGPDGVHLKNTIFVTIAFKVPVTFDDATFHTLTLIRYLGMLAGRPQNFLKFGLRIGSDQENSAFLRVYWSMPPKRDPSHEENGPHPADVLLDAARQPEEFARVLASWLDRQQGWHDARLRFSNSFAEQKHYGIDRLIGAANMFDILPSSAVPLDAPLTDELKAAKEAGRTIFLRLPQSLARDSVLGALGRIGKSNLKQKIHHRAQWLTDAVGNRFPEFVTVTDEAVNCRNHYVHGTTPRFDYNANFNAVGFFIDTLEFVFAASGLIEAGWDVKAWSEIPTSMSHPFGRYRVNYSLSLQNLKALLPQKTASSTPISSPMMDMWIFGYGSLMWDNWESSYGCLQKCPAVVKGYRRTFNKASTKNRGTKDDPCPTLNLEQDATGECKGMAFSFPDQSSGDVLGYLAKREGKNFQLELLTVWLEDGTQVQAYVPVYHGTNLISATLKEKASMVRKAKGTESSGEDYVREIAELLAKLRIDDPAVKELWEEVQRQRSENNA